MLSVSDTRAYAVFFMDEASKRAEAMRGRAAAERYAARLAGTTVGAAYEPRR